MGFLGCVFFFDRALLTLGNLAFIGGLVIVLGLERTTKFFVKKNKRVPSLVFLAGIGLIIYGYPVIGFVLELYGVWRLFATFLPNVVNTLKMLPGAAAIMETPPISYLVDYINDSRRLPS